MKESVANKKNVQQTESVENLQPLFEHVAMSGADASTVAAMLTYLKNADIPILSEFCYENGYFEDSITDSQNEVILAIYKMFETKKRGTLERMIYSGELNATIGVHVMKGWQEFKPAERQTETKPWIEVLTPDEAREYHRLTHKLHGLSGETAGELMERRAREQNANSFVKISAGKKNEKREG